ncbi:MAG: Gfo/Idh/MocA family oxidoreductase [Kiritimatiellales bacterium]
MSSHHTEKKRRRFAYVGTGSRVKMFLDPVATSYAEDSEIVGLCDSSMVRAEYHRDRIIRELGYREVPLYKAADFHRMLEETKPDTVVVCSVDCTHDYYITESLHAGCSVVTEKPMTVNAEKCQSVLDAVSETQRPVQVTFNYRWAPGATKVKELLSTGVIGNIYQVNMEYCLNTSHGADYFRRWHSIKECSGGLLVHKSTHHFDLINWWIDAVPDRVFARGGLFFYGKENAVKRGDEVFTKYDRYHGNITSGKQDPFAFIYDDADYDQVYNRNIYLDAEKENGYLRDMNVFRAGIDIEDVMNVSVRYRNGILLNYSLNAFSPNEGYRVTFTGNRGRIEYSEVHGAHILFEDGTKKPVNEHAHSGRHHLKVFPMFKEPYEIEVIPGKGGHGGGDILLQEQIFSANPPKDPFGRHAGHEQGAASILIGIAANRSIRTGQDEKITDLVPLRPDAARLSELI